VPGVRHLAAHGIFVAAALSATGIGGHCRAQSASADESAANLRGAGTASGGAAAALSGLGCAQVAGAFSAVGSGAAGTIHRILLRRGLVRPWDRHQTALQRFERAQPNQLWQMDFKGSKGWDRPVGPLSLLDDHSRYLIALRGTWTTQAEAVREQLESAFVECGVPEAMLMDHGTPWWNARTPTGATWLTVWLMQQGIQLHWSGYRHPQTQGKVERFHGSLQRAQLRRGVPDQQRQQWLDEYRYGYPGTRSGQWRHHDRGPLVNRLSSRPRAGTTRAGV
jgi:Integrase core domain